MKRLLTNLLFVLALSCATLSAQELHKIIFTPQWQTQAQFAGYYVAIEKGFYKESGLDVEIVSPGMSTTSISRLKHGEADVISTQLLQAMVAKHEGIDLVNILQSSQTNGLVVVTQPGITSLAELSGKRVAAWTSGFSELARCMARDNEHNIQWINIPSGVNYFVSGAVDGILTMYYNEYFQVMNCGRRVTLDNTFHLADYGYNIPEDGLYCLKSTYRKRSKDMNLFAEASRRGWEYARAHPEESVEIVRKWMKKDNIASSLSHQRWMLEKIMELQVNKETCTASYTLDPAIYKFANDILRKNGFIRKDIPYDEFVAPKAESK